MDASENFSASRPAPSGEAEKERLTFLGGSEFLRSIHCRQGTNNGRLMRARRPIWAPCLTKISVVLQRWFTSTLHKDADLDGNGESLSALSLKVDQ